MKHTLLPILALCLILHVSPLMAREISVTRLSLPASAVRFAVQESFVASNTTLGEEAETACGKAMAETGVDCRPLLVHFEIGSAALTGLEKNRLQEQLSRCRFSPARRFAVIGHTCALGTKERNQALSRERAVQVAQLLTNAGYQVSAIQALGSSAPLPGNLQAAGNRRVEIRLVAPSS